MCDKMWTSKLDAILERNADLWAAVTTRWGTIPYTTLLLILVIYNFAIAVTLTCAGAGGALVADQIVTDPVLQEDAWILPFVAFSIRLLEYTWAAAVLGFGASCVLRVAVILKRRQQQEGV